MTDIKLPTALAEAIEAERKELDFPSIESLVLAVLMDSFNVPPEAVDEKIEVSAQDIRRHEKNGTTLWIWADVCRVLDLRNPTLEMRRVHPDHCHKVHLEGNYRALWAVTTEGLKQYLLKGKRQGASDLYYEITMGGAQ